MSFPLHSILSTVRSVGSVEEVKDIIKVFICNINLMKAYDASL